MRALTGLALALLLCTLTACGSNSAPDESPAGEKTPAVPSPVENMEESTVYDCGGLQIALPNKYLEQLEVETELDPSGLEGYTPLMSVREKASVEAAERDFGSSEDVGILFGFARLNQGAYEQLREAAGYGIEFFARDGEAYYAQTCPTNTQFYRGQAIDKESDDWKNWETLAALGDSVREDIIQRNDLTALAE